MPFNLNFTYVPNFQASFILLSWNEQTPFLIVIRSFDRQPHEIEQKAYMPLRWLSAKIREKKNELEAVKQS